MSKRVISVQFGTSKTGLSTVGYRLYNVDGTAYAARVTSGITEIGSGTGFYAAEAEIPATFSGLIVWDTGDASIRYALGEISSTQLNRIEDNCDKVNMIWNYFRTEKEMYNRLFDRLNGLRDLVKDNMKLAKPTDTSKIEKSINELSKKEAINLNDIEKLFNSALKTITINPEVKMPNVDKMVDVVGKMNTSVNNLLKKDYVKNYERIADDIKKIEEKVMVSMKSINQNILGNMGTIAKAGDLKSLLSNVISDNNKLMKEFERTNKILEELKDDLKKNTNPAEFIQGLFSVVKLQETLAEIMKNKNNDLGAMLIYGSGNK